MESFIARARAFAEETAKKSREIANETAKYSEKLAADAAVNSKLFAEEASRRTLVLAEQSMLIADEASKRSKLLAEEAARRAEVGYRALVKEMAAIPTVSSLTTANKISVDKSSVSEEEKADFGITDDLCEFVKGLSIETFKAFPIQEVTDAQDLEASGLLPSPSPSAVTDVQIKSSQVSQDLTEWQLRHATLILKLVPEMSKFRYLLCPRSMKEKIFWRVYFQLIKGKVTGFELKYEEKKKQAAANENLPPAALVVASAEAAKAEPDADQDLDAYLMGSGTGGDDEDDDDFDPDDFDQFVNNVSLDGPSPAEDGKKDDTIQVDTTDSDGSDGVLVHA